MKIKIFTFFSLGTILCSMTAIASSSCSQKYSIPESFIGAISENTPIKYTGDSNVTNISQLSFMLTFFNKNKDIIWSNNINKVILEKLTLCENDTILQTADVENFEWVNNVLCLKSGLEFNTNDWNDTGTNLLNSNKQYHFEIFIKVSGFHLHFDNVLFTTPNILSARTLYNVHDTLAQGDDQFIPFPYIDRENPNNYGDVQWYVGAIGFHGKLPTFIAHAHDYSAGTWTNPNGNDMGEHNVVDGQFTAYIDAHTSDGLNYNFYSAACSYDNDDACWKIAINPNTQYTQIQVGLDLDCDLSLTYTSETGGTAIPITLDQPRLANIQDIGTDIVYEYAHDVPAAIDQAKQQILDELGGGKIATGPTAGARWFPLFQPICSFHNILTQIGDRINPTNSPSNPGVSQEQIDSIWANPERTAWSEWMQTAINKDISDATDYAKIGTNQGFDFNRGDTMTGAIFKNDNSDSAPASFYYYKAIGDGVTLATKWLDDDYDGEGYPKTLVNPNYASIDNYNDTIYGGGGVDTVYYNMKGDPASTYLKFWRWEPLTGTYVPILWESENDQDWTLSADISGPYSRAAYKLSITFSNDVDETPPNISGGSTYLVTFGIDPDERWTAVSNPYSNEVALGYYTPT